MDSTFVGATTLDRVVAREWHWIAVLLRNGFDYYQLAFLLKSAVVAHPEYDSSISIALSDLRACIEERLGGTAA